MAIPPFVALLPFVAMPPFVALLRKWSYSLNDRRCGLMPRLYISLVYTGDSAQPPCVTTYAGHLNERNFVGLSASQDGYLACGSETNEVYCYYKVCVCACVCVCSMPLPS